MQVSPISSYAATGASTDSTAAAIPAKKTTLDQGDFLKLLAKQFQTQDPMKPMDDTSFIAQMAQFTSLQQTSTMATNITQLLAGQQATTANSYIGRSVTVDLGDGTTQTGNVSAIDNSSGAPQLVIDSKTYAITSVLRVEPGVVATPTTPTTPTTPAPTETPSS